MQAENNSAYDDEEVRVVEIPSMMFDDDWWWKGVETDGIGCGIKS